MAEQLRMEAVVTDRFSEPLKRLQERLKGIREPERLKEVGEHFEKAKERVERLTEALKGGLEPAMAGVGISGLALGGTFAGILQATRSFAESTASLSRLSKETGISIDRIREMDSVFGKLGVKAEAVNGSMVTFRQNLHDIQRNRGAAFGWLTTQEPQLAKQLHDAKSPDEALGRAYGFLQRIPDATERGEASQRLFGTPEMGRIQEMSKPEIADAIKEADDAQGKISEAATKASEAWETATGKLHDALIGLRDDIGSHLLPFLNKVTEGTASFIENHHVATLAGGAVASGGATVVATHLGRRLFRSWLGRTGSAAAEAAPTSAAARAGRAVAPGIANDNWAFHAANDNAAPAAEAGGLPSRVAPKLGAGLRFLGPLAWPLMLRDLGEMSNPTTPAGAPYRLDQLPDWAGKTERARRSADEFKRDPEAARGRVMMQRELTEVQTAATKDGTVEGLKQATPEAEKKVKGWFDWIWKSSFMGGDGNSGMGGSPRLWNASYETGAGGGGIAGRSFGGGRFNSLSHAGRGGASKGAGTDGQFTSAPAGPAGTYRPTYRVGEADLDERVVDTIAGEVSTKNGPGVDAVINNMMNRVGSKGWGPSGNLLQVARARGQYAGYRRASTSEAAFIRSRIQAIASGGVEDNTHGSNSYRAGSYHGPWYRKHVADGIMIGGNRFAFEHGVSNGPFAPYGDSLAGNGSQNRERQRVLDKNRILTQGSGMGFMGAAQVDPQGHVTVNLNGFPSGTKASTSTGGFFKGVKVNRGRAMSEASQDD